MRPLRAATRGSELALAQTRRVTAALGEPAEEVVVSTVGDRRPDVPIWELGGRGVFVKEVQAAVLDGRADFAVHSAKDLPSSSPPGLVIAAVLERGDPRDALVGTALADLPPGAHVATGSVRRRAQLASLRPDLTFAGLRGNIGTRLEKAADFDAVVVAAAALVRLGLTGAAAELLDPGVVLPQVGQGAIAVEAREDDERVLAALARLEHRPTRLAVDAERAYLRRLGGGCDLPVAGHARVAGDGRITLSAMLATLDGHIVLSATGSGDDPEALGTALADRLVDESGGAWLLESLRGLA
ncbi:MAG TPA: hydroxymethylbilane synthase [Acidimicrobiales bacterium]|nr:hydroxymethylbilane synthase [Acidimicrobiales bacterium]